MNSLITRNTQLIKSYASKLGFLSCGISEACFLEDEAPKLEKWLKHNYHGKMNYMNNHFDKRLDPRKLVPGAKSVVSLLLNYHTDKNQYDREAPKISKYAFGKDYHIVIKKKLKKFLKFINREIGEVQGRVFVDSAPVMDKVWASKSGLGWIGKNTNLISKKVGSFFFIAELIIDLELVYDPPATDHCGNCTACIDACPTDALIEPYQIDGSKCISYLTIELKEKIPSEFEGKMDQWVFGCDVCQSVCPWNRFSKPNEVSEFEPDENLISMNKNDWEELTEEVFNDLFKNSAIKRTNFSGIKRNIKFLKQ